MKRKGRVSIQIQKEQSKYGIWIKSKTYPDLDVGDSYYLPCNDIKAAKALAKTLDDAFKQYLDVDYEGCFDMGLPQKDC